MAKKKTIKKKTTKKVAKKTAKKVVKKAAKKVAKKAAKKVAKKTTKKTVTKVVKKVEKKAAKKVAKKTTAKTAKKAIKKAAKKAPEKKVAQPKAVKETKAKVSKKTDKKDNSELAAAIAKMLAPEKKAKGKKDDIVEVNSFDELLEEIDQEFQEEEEVVLTDAEGRRYCRVGDCDQIAMVDTYCRFHYLLFWKKIQNRKKILADGKFERYVEELTSRYPDKMIEVLRKDLRTEKDFLNAIEELEIEDVSSGSGDDNDDDSFLEEIRGVATDKSKSRDDEDY